MELSFQSAVDPYGVSVFDPLEQRQLRVQTSGPVDIESCSADDFPYPVDRACTFETAELFFGQLVHPEIHDEDGTFVGPVHTNTIEEFGYGRHVIGFSAPIKLYAIVETDLAVAVSNRSVRLEFSEPAVVTLGARSMHERPAATITTTDRPHDMVRAIEALSSSLKDTTPERSWPTLRGHPPVIDVGEDLDVPDDVTPAETGVTITVPPTYRHLYTIAPLSYYLGAQLELGNDPAIHADGFTHPLDTPSFEDGVARVLKQAFFLDCIVRTEGIYDYDLHERTRVEHQLPSDLEGLYERSLPEQLETYLSIPFEALDEYIPRWCMTAYLPPEPAGVKPVPFIVNELGIVRESVGRRQTRVLAQPAGVADGAEAFVRAGLSNGVRSTSASDQQVTTVTPSKFDDSIEHAWFDDDIPMGASKATVEAFEARLGRSRTDEAIKMAVVCNDARMLQEHDSLDEVYGIRADLEYRTKSHFGTSTEELAAILKDDEYDFLHYIGHATADGLECMDGHLDVNTLTSVAVDSFFLNACNSYEHALTLTENGALAGVGTIGDVVNEHAVEIGQTMARSLNCGFPFRAAVELVQENLLIGDQYIIVGDGATDLVQTDGGIPAIDDIESQPDGTYSLTATAYTTKEFAIGTISTPTIDRVKEYFLPPGDLYELSVTKDELRSQQALAPYPVRIDGEILWQKRTYLE